MEKIKDKKKAMTDYEYLIHLLYCAVHGTDPLEKSGEVSFESVLALGKIHEVANIAYLSVEKLKNKPDEDILNRWQLAYYFSVQRDMRQKAAYEEIKAALHKKGIRTLEAQGTITKTLYPSSELRMMSDIDFVIDFDKQQEAEEIMRSLGYEIKRLKDSEFSAKKGEILIEMHTDFFEEFMYNRRERFSDALSSPFDYAAPDSVDKLSYKLSDTYFYLYSILHIIKHFETTGCGIRRILDIYYLKKAYEGKTDNDVIERVINENGFKKSRDTLFALEALWFENTPSDLDLSEAIRDVIFSGNHGNGEIFTRNNVRKDRAQGVKMAKIKRVFSFIFPKREYIYLGYPELRERGYSLFRCQLYRIGKTLRRFSFSHAVKYIKTVLFSR